MRLSRDAIGGYAEVGGPCPCVRGLPVRKRVPGSQRNRVVRVDGFAGLLGEALRVALVQAGQFRDPVVAWAQGVNVGLEISPGRCRLWCR
jgi:hypothetical protein